MGHCINLPQNVKELATSLPRYPKDMTLIIVKGKENTLKDVTVRKQKLHDALVWLIRNNPHYSALTIKEPLLWPSVQNEPSNEYQVSHLATMAIPTLFPGRKGDPTNPGLLTDVPFQEELSIF